MASDPRTRAAEGQARFKVVHLDAGPEANLSVEREIFGRVGGEVIAARFQGEDELRAAVSDADAILVVFAQIGRREIEAARRCKVIARYGIGVDNVDVAAATEHGIAVLDIADHCTEEVANHTIMFLLVCARRFLSIHRAVMLGSTRYLDLQPIMKGVHTLHGETLGLLGFGRIARSVAEKAKAFDLRVISHDPHVSRGSFQELEVEPVPRHRIFEEADYVSCHLPLNAETYHSIGAQELARMKRTAFFINTSRGAVVDEDALLKMLQSARIAGAALDVYEEEPIEPDNPLGQLPNVVLTPHVAFYSDQSSRLLRRTMAEETARVLEGKRPAARYWYNQPPVGKAPS